jgi:hypothetical protein
VPERRASRFAVEVLFLVALAVGLVLAEAPPLLIGGLMLLGWLIVALFEWAAWRDEPHFGSGLPPRYYVPQISLPPRRPLEQVGLGYPAADQRDEAPTWIASPALRAEVLGEWPVAPPAAGEETQEEPPGDEIEPVDEPQPDLWGRRDEGDGDADPWTVAELPAEPEATGEPRERPPLVDLVPTAQRTARHRLDPLPEPAQKRRFRRRQVQDDGPTVDVPARPAGVRVLPGRSRREN